MKGQFNLFLTTRLESVNMLLTNIILSSETDRGTPQSSMISVLFSARISPVDISSLIDTLSLIVTPTQAITLGKCY